AGDVQEILAQKHADVHRPEWSDLSLLRGLREAWDVNSEALKTDRLDVLVCEHAHLGQQCATRLEIPPRGLIELSHGLPKDSTIREGDIEGFGESELRRNVRTGRRPCQPGRQCEE